MPDPGFASRSHSDRTIDDAIIALSQAVELAAESSVSVEQVKATVRSLCAEAKRTGTPVEALIIGLRESVDTGRYLVPVADNPRERVRRDVVSYLIRTYYEDGQ